MRAKRRTRTEHRPLCGCSHARLELSRPPRYPREANQRETNQRKANYPEQSNGRSIRAWGSGMPETASTP
jgi:hypothetical protein